MTPSGISYTPFWRHPYVSLWWQRRDNMKIKITVDKVANKLNFRHFLPNYSYLVCEKCKYLSHNQHLIQKSIGLGKDFTDILQNNWWQNSISGKLIWSICQNFMILRRCSLPWGPRVDPWRLFAQFLSYVHLEADWEERQVWIVLSNWVFRVVDTNVSQKSDVNISSRSLARSNYPLFLS